MDDLAQDLDRMWARYKRDGAMDARDILMIHYSPLVKYVASRVATPTTVNTAIVSGVVPTTPGVYSGGAENFPGMCQRSGGRAGADFHPL